MNLENKDVCPRCRQQVANLVEIDTSPGVMNPHAITHSIACFEYACETCARKHNLHLERIRAMPPVQNRPVDGIQSFR